MLVKSDNHSHFKRIDNIITEVLSTGEEKPVLFLKRYFPNVHKLNETTVDYMNRYIERYPQYVEIFKTIVEEKKSGEQLELF